MSGYFGFPLELLLVDAFVTFDLIFGYFYVTRLILSYFVIGSAYDNRLFL